MQKIEFNIETLSPVLITSDSGEVNTVGTLNYIPGNTILGVFANLYIKEKNLKNAHEDELFNNWFLNGKIKFSNAYIRLKDNNNYYPIPFSIQKDKKTNSIYDLLDLEDDSDINTKGLSGFANINNKDLDIEHVKQNINFHNSLEGEQIFHYASIRDRQTFKGEIIGEKEELEKFLKTFRLWNEVFIGRSKTAQYGKVRLILEKEAKEIKEVEVNTYANLTFTSDVIIYNENGYSCSDTKTLQEYFGNDIKITKAFIKSGIKENFVSIWNLKKYSENCILAGSCIKVEVKNNDGKKKINTLYIHGLGERLNEGFGRFLIDFQNKENLNLATKSNKTTPKPQGEIPSTVKDLGKYYIQKDILQKARKAAITESDLFTKLPSKSLLGRLRLILNDSKDLSDFQNNIQKLRKPAQDQLERSRNNNSIQTLKELITNINIKTKVKVDFSKFEKICKLINDNPYEDPRFVTKLEKEFFNNLFENMTKKSKRDE
jgi:CRISPR-associated protein Csx10